MPPPASHPAMLRAVMADPIKAPELPASVPDDLRRFVDCTADAVTISDGPQAWVSLPAEASAWLSKDAKPDLRITAGSQPGAATITVKVGFISASLAASVSEGRLVIATNALPMWAPAAVGQGIQRFVDELNAWFRQNVVGLAPPAFGAGEVTLRKVPIAASAAVNPPAPDPLG
jgi:hypothetical protein